MSLCYILYFNFRVLLFIYIFCYNKYGDNMENLDILIDGKHYQFLNCISIENKNYVAYTDSESIYIGEYSLKNNQLEILPIDNKTAKLVKEELNYE